MNEYQAIFYMSVLIGLGIFISIMLSDIKGRLDKIIELLKQK